MGTKIKGQYVNRSTFWMIKYINGSAFSKARYMNGVGFEILARTPGPNYPCYPPPPPRFQDTIQQNSSFVVCSNRNESLLLPVNERRDQNPSQQTGSGKGTESGNFRLLFPDISGTKKERKVTFNYRPLSIEPMNRETVFSNGDSQACKTVDETQRLGCLHRSDRCIPSRSDTSSVPKVSSIRLRRSCLSLHGLTVRNVPKSVDFLELMDVIAAFLCQRAISVFPYLGDWLIRYLIRNRLISQTKFCIQTIQSLGFIPNLKKSELFPSQKFMFIGVQFLTQQNLVRVPTDRVQNLILTIKYIMSCKQVSARTLLSLLGKLSATADLVLLGRLHLRPLQMCLLSVWRPHILPLNHPITITGMIRFHLLWWINTKRFETGTPIHPPDPKYFLYTDASHFGWGAHLEPMSLSFHGRWTEDQSQLHINMLEMMAIRLALKQAITFIHHSCIMISTDNTTVVSYINKQGGTHYPNLCVEVWEILHWCLEHDIVIRTVISQADSTS